MRKIIISFIILFSLLCIPTSYAAIANVGNTTTYRLNQTPSVRSVEFEDDGILVTYDFTVQSESSNQQVSTLSFHGFDNAIIADTLCMPKRTDSFTIPFSCDPRFELLLESHHDIDIPADITLSFRAEREAGNGEFCSFLPLQRYRDYPVAMVEVGPVKISASKDKISVLDKLQYKIFYNSPKQKSSTIAVFEPWSLVDPNCLYSTNTLTPILPPGIESISRPVDTPGFLILSVPKFRDHLEPFVKWKKLMGYTIYEAYDNGWTPESIKAYIRNLYSEHSDLQYLLIVGDHGLVPGESMIMQPHGTVSTEEEFITDFYYGCTQGDSALYADIYRGRWPVRTVSELENIIEKSTRYEMEPSMNPQFYNSAAHFGYFEDDIASNPNDPENNRTDGTEDKRFVRTCEDVRTYLIENDAITYIDRLYTAKAEYEPGCKFPSNWSPEYTLETLMPDDLRHENGFTWNADSTSVVNSINESRLYFLYRGHGFPEGWGLLGNKFAKFSTKEINKLTNCDEMPLIFSITCDTGDHRADNCFARNFLSSSYGGTYAMFAQSCTGLSGKNDMLTSFFFNCIWPKPGLNLERFETNYYWDNNPNIYNSLPALRLGQMLDISINGTAEHFSLSNDVTSIGRYVSLTTHCFGDPSILFRKQVPKHIDNVYVSRNSENNTVYVSALNLDRSMKYFSFYDKTTDKSYLYIGTDATYTATVPGGERYVDVLVYDSSSIPYLDQGENYEGYVMSENESRLVGHSLHTDGKYLSVNYFLAECDYEKRVDLYVHDLETNDMIYNCSLDSTVCGIEASVPVYVNNGMMVVTMMVNGRPCSSMKVFVPLH